VVILTKMMDLDLVENSRQIAGSRSLLVSTASQFENPR
jgi:hypothetical protein